MRLGVDIGGSDARVPIEDPGTVPASANGRGYASVMRLGVDIDGVCARFADEANYFLARYCGQQPIAIEQWDWYVNYGEQGEAAWNALWEHIFSSEFMLHLDPEPYAQVALERLADAGHDITYITARNPKLRAQTQAWLNHHDFPGALVMERQKHLTDFDLYLDDHIDNVYALRDAGRRAVLFVQPWNVAAYIEDPDIEAVVSWPEFEALVKEAEVLSR